MRGRNNYSGGRTPRSYQVRFPELHEQEERRIVFSPTAMNAPPPSNRTGTGRSRLLSSFGNVPPRRQLQTA